MTESKMDPRFSATMELQRPGSSIGSCGDATYRHPRSVPAIDVCPHCKRGLVLIDPPGAYGFCGEHGDVVAMRSAVVNRRPDAPDWIAA